jgi:hypothetical protein
MFARLAHFLLPQESNNYRAKVLHNRSISLFSVAFLVFQLAISSIVLIKPAVLGYASQISPNKVIELTNIERAKVGAPPVTENSVLSTAARQKAGDMYAFNYWAHVSPTGKEPWAFFKDNGYNYIYAGENLARDFASPEATVEAWMNSPSHRENLLNPRYKEIGIAVVDGTLQGSDTTIVVQLFGTQKGQAVEAKTSIPKVAAKEVIPSPGLSLSPSPSPTSVPVVAMVTNPPTDENGPVLAQSRGREIPILNPFSLTQTISFISLMVLLGLFITDALVIWRKGVLRLTGRSLAHVLFLLGIVMIVILSQRGTII